jgi:hypothetical protein
VPPLPLTAGIDPFWLEHIVEIISARPELATYIREADLVWIDEEFENYGLLRTFFTLAQGLTALYSVGSASMPMAVLPSLPVPASLVHITLEDARSRDLIIIQYTPQLAVLELTGFLALDVDHGFERGGAFPPLRILTDSPTLTSGGTKTTRPRTRTRTRTRMRMRTRTRMRMRTRTRTRTRTRIARATPRRRTGTPH